ncbi:pilus assembly protein PilM [Planctomycetota bacterium]
MLGFGKKQAFAIGIDMSRDGLRLAQLANSGKDLSLIAGGSQCCPEEIEVGSASWQHWVVEKVHQLVGHGGFRGKAISTAIPSSDIYVDQIKLPKPSDGQMIEDAIFNRIKNKMPFKGSRESTMIRYMPSDQDNAVVMAADRDVINGHLAIFEKAGLQIKTMGVWPEALVNCYIRFFGRRKADVHEIVMLINVEHTCTKVVICRHQTLLFARSLPLGAVGLVDEQAINRLVLEVTACRRDFMSLYKNSPIARLIFMSGPSVDTSIYATVAKQLEIQAQIGDCLVAVEMPKPLGEVLDRRDQHISWATAFGLSLS